MIDQKQINKVMINALKEVCGCEVIRANQSAMLPDYPFVSYNIVNPLISKNRSYAEYADRREKEITQVWSITVQSDTDAEALVIVMTARDWLEETGFLVLQDAGIAVRKVGEITNRDNLISIDYEYRKGFDFTLALINRIEIAREELENYIEMAELKGEIF